MTFCPICNNEDFKYVDGWDDTERIAICTVCGEDFIECDDYEDEEILV